MGSRDFKVRMVNPTGVPREGLCNGCKQWFSRDDLQSMNVAVHEGRNSVADRIPLRLCCDCHDRLVVKLKDMAWVRRRHEREAK